jgi:zinc protease
MKNAATVEEFALPDGGRVFVAPMATKDVVAIEGSVFGGPNFFPNRNSAIPDIATDLLDAGTARMNKQVLREGLAARGASLSFMSSGDRTYFSATCFPEDVAYVLRIASECLYGATFPQKEIAAAKQRALGILQESKSDTRTQAHIKFLRLLYDSSHVNFPETTQDLETRTRAVEREDLQDFRNRVGGGLVLAVTGDVHSAAVRRAVETITPRAKGTAGMTKALNTRAQNPQKERIHIPDKANIDLFMGAYMPITKRHELYHALIIVADMLGGGFASYLTKTIRERDGLTYGIRAGLGGLSDGADGYFRIWSTFSPQLFEKSVIRLRYELKQFFTKHVTPKNADMKKEEIIGSYLLGLSTTRGMAQTLLMIGIDNKELTYLYEYPDIIQKTTFRSIQNAAKLVPVQKFSSVSAGTFAGT